MKTKLLFSIATTLSLLTSWTWGQGTFVLDQFSSLDETPFPVGGSIQQAQPGGQSFTPSLSSVGFVRFNLNDANPNNGLGATVYVNLRSDSITGTILGTTSAVVLTDGSVSIVTFLFITTVEVTPGVTYYFQPVVELGGDNWRAVSGGYNYPGGSFFTQGIAGAGDLWFQEGVIVPEPSIAVLFLIGGGFLLYIRHNHHA